MPLTWLPKLVLLENYGGNWDTYFEAVYEAFRQDFLTAQFHFDGKRVGLKRHPIASGREATFWHFISEEKIEADRIPDLRRCERISWPRAIMNNFQDASLVSWSEQSGQEQRIHIWCETAEYLLIIADRGDYVLPWTGYPVTHSHQQEKLRRRWERAQRG